MVCRMESHLQENGLKERSNNRQSDNYGLELGFTFRVLWQSRVFIIGMTILSIIITYFISLNLPNTYKADSLLAPVSDSSNNGFSGLSGQLGNLASFAGLGLKQESVSKTQLALETLTSRSFLMKFFDDYELKPLIMAVDGWDEEFNELKFDESIYDNQNGKWLSSGENDGNNVPSLFEVYEEFVQENLLITVDKETGLVSISIFHRSPVVAKDILDKLIEAINRHMRNVDIVDAKANISYLEEALEGTEVSDMRSIFFQLIEKQQQTMMLASVKNEYVFKIIDPPMIPEESYGPKRLLMCIIIGFLCFILTSVMSLAKRAWR